MDEHQRRSTGEREVLQCKVLVRLREQFVGNHLLEIERKRFIGAILAKYPPVSRNPFTRQD